MKHLISSLLCVSVLAACAPRDVSVVSDADRSKFQGRSSQSNTPSGGVSTGFRLGNYSLAAHLVERQSEAVQALRWVQDPALARQEGQEVSRNIDRAEGQPEIVIIHEDREGQSTEFDQQEKATLSVVADKKIVDGKEVSRGWKLSGISQRTWIKKDKSIRLSLADSSRRLEILEGDAPEKFRLIYKIEGKLELRKGEARDVHDWTQELDFDVTREADGSFSVTRGTAAMNISTMKPEFQNYAVKTDGGLKFQFGKCVQVQGKVVQTSGKRPQTLLFSGNDLSVQGSSFRMPFEACEKRSVLDIYRIIADPPKAAPRSR